MFAIAFSTAPAHIPNIYVEYDNENFCVETHEKKNKFVM